MFTIEDIVEVFKPVEPGSMADRRIQICNACDRFKQKSKLCTECGCLMPLKTKMPSMGCPLHKWLPEE
jgi:hypothetical protein